MMYLSSIHNKSVGVKENDYIQQHNSFVNAIFEEMETAITNANELIEFNIFTEEAGQSLGNSIVNGIRKIGEKILELIRRLGEFISDSIEKIKAFAYDSKSDEQKLRDFIRKYPDKAKDIKVAVSNGELAFPSYKDLKDFYENIDKILLDIKKGQIDPNSLRGRWEKIKSKIVDNEKFVKTTAATLGIVITTAGGYYALNEFVFKRAKHLQESGYTEDNYKQYAALAPAVLTAIEKLSQDPKYADKCVGTTKLLNEIAGMVNRVTMGTYSKRLALDKKVLKGLCAGCKTTQEKLEAIKNNIDITLKYGESQFGPKAKGAADAVRKFTENQKMTDLIANMAP